MPKITEFLSNIFSKQKLVTDAAPIPENNTEEEENDPNQVQSISSLEYQRQNTNSSVSSNMESLPPLKQHMLVTQDIANRTFDNTNDLQLTTPRNNNNTVTAHNITNIQRQNVLQFSNMNGLHIGNSYNFNSTTLPSPTTSDNRSVSSSPSTKNNASEENRVFKKTKTIESMMKSKEPLEFRTMNVIAEHMENWEYVARKLNFSDGQIQHFTLDNYIKGTKEIVYQFLLDWSQNEDDACLGTITRVLWRTRNQQTVYYLKEVWKNMSTESNSTNNN